MKEWGVVWSEDAEVDLDSIYSYIATELLEPSIAFNQTERIKTAIYGLKQMPKRYSLYQTEPWRSKGVRHMVVNNYIVFYHPNDESGEVLILRIIYGGRNIDEIFKIGKDI